MNISTNYPFNGKHLSGKIYDKWFQKTDPGLAFSDINTNGFDAISLENLVIVNVSVLTEIRDEINELITFMVSLEPGKEKASYVDNQDEPKGLIIQVEKCQRCHKDHKIKFMNLITPVDNKYTMWGMCENTHQPVLMGMKDVDEQNKIAIDEIVKKIDKRPICEICKNNVSEGILYCRFNTVPTKTHTCIPCGSSRSGTLPFYTFIPYDGIKNE